MGKKKPNTTLDLNIISCGDLKSNYFFRKLNTYVTVSIIQDDDRNPKQQNLISIQRTPTDRTRDRNPNWNHPMKFDLETIPDGKISIKFKVMCENNVFRDSKIGDAWFPLVEDLQLDKNLRFLKFSVKDSDGKGRGELKVSYKFSGGEKEKVKIEEDKIVHIKSSSSIKFDANTVIHLVQTMEWPILPSFSVSNMVVENQEKKKTSSHDGSCNNEILSPFEMKSLSFNTGFEYDPLGKKNDKKYGITGSNKWEIELDSRAGRFPGLLARNQSECSC